MLRVDYVLNSVGDRTGRVIYGAGWWPESDEVAGKATASRGVMTCSPIPLGLPQGIGESEVEEEMPLTPAICFHGLGGVVDPYSVRAIAIELTQYWICERGEALRS